MSPPTLCADVAQRLGEPLRLIKRRGFQLLPRRHRRSSACLAAVDCPFCGQQVLVAPTEALIEAECHGCDVSFEASPPDVYRVSLDEATRPAEKHRLAFERC